MPTANVSFVRCVFRKHLSIHVHILADLLSFISFADKHAYYEFMGSVGMSCSESHYFIDHISLLLTVCLLHISIFWSAMSKAILWEFNYMLKSIQYCQYFIAYGISMVFTCLLPHDSSFVLSAFVCICFMWLIKLFSKERTNEEWFLLAYFPG